MHIHKDIKNQFENSFILAVRQSRKGNIILSKSDTIIDYSPDNESKDTVI